MKRMVLLMKRFLLSFLLITTLFTLTACSGVNVSNEGDTDTVIQIDYDSNALFNKYDIRISVNDVFLGTQSQGRMVTYRIALDEGVHSLVLTEVGNNSNSLTHKFEGKR